MSPLIIAHGSFSRTERGTAPTVAVVILNYNGWRFTLKCLKSLRGGISGSTPTFVIDNGSDDGSANILRPNLEGNEVLVENGSNKGFSGGMNTGMTHCVGIGAKYMVLLNNDTIIEKGVIEELLEFMEAHADVAVSGPRINKLENPNELQFAKYRDVSEPKDDPSLSGCAFIVRRSALKDVGLLDDNFFIYWEDYDFWQRMRKAGYRVVYVPTRARILHEGGALTSQMGGTSLYYFLRNEFLFKRRHEASQKVFLSILGRHVYEILAARNHPRQRIRALLHGLQLWIKNPPPKWES